MHEMSLTTELLSIVRQEMEKHGATRLLSITVKHGQLSQVVPDAMRFAFEVQTKDTDMEGAELRMVETPLLIRCWSCQHEFTPPNPNMLYNPCPKCGEEFGHEVVTGKELYLETIEAE